MFCFSHAVGVAFAVCLENKQAREREGVTASYDEDEGTFTRFGSFRQGTITERLQNPQEFKESVQKAEVGAVDNPFAIARPRPGDARASMRVLGDIRGASPFKRGTADYSSLRVNELPSNISRKEKSRVSLILEENFENEETKNELNDMFLAMSKSKIEENKSEEDMLTSMSSQFSDNSSTAAVAATPSSVAVVTPSEPQQQETTTVNSNSYNNNIDTKNAVSVDKPDAVGEAVNPWDLVPDQTKIKHHSRSNSKHENVKFEQTTNNVKATDTTESSVNMGDQWLASLTNKISALDENVPSKGWSNAIISNKPTEDPLDTEWEALANRNGGKQNNNNPFIAFV